MTTIKKITIENIQEFIKRKGFYWDGRIRDLYRIITRQATIEDFQGKRMVRLIVTHKNHKEEFIQRIIVSPEVFRIEKPSLRKKLFTFLI